MDHIRIRRRPNTGSGAMQLVQFDLLARVALSISHSESGSTADWQPVNCHGKATPTAAIAMFTQIDALPGAGQQASV